MRTVQYGTALCGSASLAKLHSSRAFFLECITITITIKHRAKLKFTHWWRAPPPFRLQANMSWFSNQWSRWTDSRSHANSNSNSNGNGNGAGAPRHVELVWGSEQ